MKNRHYLTQFSIVGLLLYGLVATQAQPVITEPAQSRVESVGDHLAFSVGVTGAAPLYYQWYFDSAPIPDATNFFEVVSNAQVTDSGTYSVIVSNALGSVTNSATLQITAGLQPLSSTNVVVVRVGDGSQPLSYVLGNTVYLDQYTPNGAYVNTIQIPDTLPNALILSGAPSNGVFMGFLGRSANSEYLTLGGYNVSQPNTAYLSGIASGSSRAIGVVGANGYFALAQLDSGYYTASTPGFNSVASTDGLLNFWLTGIAASSGLKYDHVAINSASYVNLASPAKTCHVAEIDPLGNVAFTASNSAGYTGLNVFNGLPMNAVRFPSLLINVGSTASPEDFAISPDYNTIYIADDSGTASAGIERWDNVAGTWQNSYTLSSGALAGASGLTVNFGASGSWGEGVTGAILYATTAGGGSNSLIQIVDNGSSSTPVTVVQAGPNQMLRGLRFGPIGAPPVISSEPQPGVVFTNGTAYFYVAAAGPLPLTYQWQLDGADISGATNSSLTLVDPAGANLGNYTVVVVNTSGSITSSPVAVTLESSPTAPYPAAVLNDNPLAFWRLDETTGTTAYDLLNNFYDGTYHNVQLGVFPGYNSFSDSNEPAAEFNPTSTASDVSGIPLDLASTNATDFSVEAWINTQGLPAYGTIVAIQAFGRYQFTLDTSSQGVPGAPEFSISTFGPFEYTEFFAESTNVIQDSNWHYIVGVCDESNAILSLYLDGQLLISTNCAGQEMVGLLSVDFTNYNFFEPLDGPPAGSPLYNEEFPYALTDTNLVIGGPDAYGDSGGFIGFISQVAIYGYALSSNQVAAHYATAGIPPSPVVITPPAPLVNSGQTIELSASISPHVTLPLYWQWSSNGAPLTWATNATVELTNLQGETALTYSVLVSNAFGTSQTSAVVTVYSGSPQLVMDIAPLDVTNGYGGTQIFSAEIQGSSPISYQWQFDGTNLSDVGGVSGSQTSMLTLAKLQLSQAGNYQLLASNAFGTNATSKATLVVEPLNFAMSNLWTTTNYGPRPSFSGNTLTLTDGNGADFASAFGNLPVNITAFKASWTYQQTATGSGGPGDGIAFVVQNCTAGASALSYGELGYINGGFLEPGLVNGINYSVAVEFGLFTGSIYIPEQTNSAPGIGFGSNAVAFGYAGSGYGGPYSPTGAVDLTNGDPIQVTVAYAEGNMNVALTDAVAATSFTTNFAVNIPAIVLSNTAYVGFTASSEWDGEDSSLQQVSDFSFTAAAAVSVSPAAQSADAGQTVTFQANPYPASPPISYQWLSNGVTLSGATNSSLVLSNVQGSGAETYSVLITNSAGNAEGSGILTIYSGPPQLLSDLPTNVVAGVGDTLNLSATFVGTFPIAYQWQFDGTNLTDGGGVAGSQTSALTLSNVQFTEAGYYQLLASNALGTNATSVATLSVVTITLSAASDWTINSNSALGGLAGIITNGTLTLTDNGEQEAVSAYWDTPVNIQNFVASWTYVQSGDGGNSRGYTFTLQNSGLTALGGTAVNLGYSGIQDSVSVQFNTFPPVGLALGIDGSIPQEPGGTGSITVPTEDPLSFTVVYSGNFLSVDLVDTITSDSFTTNYTVNIPSTVLGNTAYVGFTGADGYATSIQQVSNFSFFNFPTLTAQKTGGGGLVFTWPAGEGIVLQANTNLAGGNWVNVTNTPTIVGGNDQVTVNPGETNILFFRLAIPVP
ncbi:MAG TPA: hypothetical protein VGR14_09710 [Verrucomicrobiae bacterium]|nr:hypothetical protein [Verrucomicrobiae bacterium]